MTARERQRRGVRAGERRSDRDLLAAALAGEREAFVAVLRRHDARLRGLAARLLAGDRDRIDDVLQDAYVHAYVGLPGFRGDAQVGTWLYRIVYNACVDEIRRTGRRPEPVDTDDVAWDRPAGASGPDTAVSAADDVARALAALPADQRGALVLVLGEGFDTVTAARMLGVPRGTVASRVSRARAAVRRLLDDGGER